MSDSELEYDYEDVGEPGFTGVFLGFADQEASRCELSPVINHLGGSPVWFQNHGPDPTLYSCSVCKKPMDLLAQLYCPWPDKDYDRTLYIFACSDTKCFRKEGCIKAIRGIEKNEKVSERIAKEIEPERPETNIVPALGNLGDLLFGGSSGSGNDANTSTGNTGADKSTSGGTAGGSTKNRTENQSVFFKTKKRNFISVTGKYLCRHIAVDEEFIEEKSNDPKYANVEIVDEQEKEQDKDEKSVTDGVADIEINETQLRGDPVFSNFVEVVENNPDQILRYKIGLKPLFYSSKDNLPKELKNLSSKALELQLMPQLISDLETEDMIADGMEWGSIYIATDKDDRLPNLNEGGVGYVEEWVGVQWEQD